MTVIQTWLIDKRRCMHCTIRWIAFVYRDQNLCTTNRQLNLEVLVLIESI